MNARRHSSWAPPLSVAGVGKGHTHELSRATRLMVKLLILAEIALMVTVGLLIFFVYQQQQYIEGRGEQRDRENARLEEQIRQAQCDLLDMLPEGGLLDRPRAKYGCGPGIPIENLTPEEQAQVAGRTPSTVQPPAAVQPPTPDLGSSAVPDPPRPPANTPGPTRSPEPPAPTPEPTGPLDPITDLACDLVGACI